MRRLGLRGRHVGSIDDVHPLHRPARHDRSDHLAVERDQVIQPARGTLASSGRAGEHDADRVAELDVREQIGVRAAVGDDAQVLVVTHLAQVAALASTQYVVDKTVKRGATTVSASPVDGDQRVAEIARMLSGSDSESARQHAQELLA